MAIATSYPENTDVEQPAITFFGKLGWETMDAMHETPVPGGSFFGRESEDEG